MWVAQQLGSLLRADEGQRSLVRKRSHQRMPAPCNLIRNGRAACRSCLMRVTADNSRRKVVEDEFAGSDADDADDSDD